VDRTSRAALDRALDEEQDLLLVYQPIHEARSGRIVAAEALLRQRRQNGEIREAAIIHEAAEKSSGNEIFALDSLLMKKAFAEAKRWQAGAAVRLNVNLSPREFEETDIASRVSSLVSACGIAAEQVNLEITETSYIEHPKETMHALESLVATGVHLWLDDFGTGHSSLTHLQHFPLEGLKIAGSFVKPLPSDRRCRAIVTALIRLAHDLGLEVTAEEVERRDQLDFLLELGCDSIQGFLFSRPMEGAALERLL
jgi:EAL domain-containing protein (putative c-di-GMP-specific phosphodiesterase class I)